MALNLAFADKCYGVMADAKTGKTLKFDVLPINSGIKFGISRSPCIGALFPSINGGS